MLSVYNETLQVLHLWRNPFGESAEKGLGESVGFTAIKQALAGNTTLTSYDGPAGPLLNVSVRQTNRNSFLRLQSIADAAVVQEVQDQVRSCFLTESHATGALQVVTLYRPHNNAER